MTIRAIALIGTAALTLAWADTPGSTKKSGVSRNAEAVNLANPAVSMYIWSDKQVYRPGESLTLRWTVKANEDPNGYTVVAYRQNNNDGRKVFLPKGTDEATDLNGMTYTEGFVGAPLQNQTKAVLAGVDGKLPAITIPDEPGMHTIAVELRDASGTVILKTSYLKIGVATEQVTVSGPITMDTTWVNTKSYLISGIVAVKEGATLTIEPGTVIQGASGSQPPSLLLVTRNGRIVANGTKSRPIIMTSAQPIGQRKRGDWGGLIMLGKAPINVGAGAAGNTNAAGTFFIEGLNATEDGLYGGTDPNHSCGVTRYVRVEYAGSILSPNNETNAFTWGGCGKGTVANHLQAIYGLDDSFEWFGGNMDASYLVGGLGADDYLDYQLGYTGRIQYGLFYQSGDARGNRGIEGDNSEYDNSAVPVSNPTMYNLTFVGSGQPGFDEAASPGIFLRRGARGSFNNVLLTNFYSAGVEFTDANTQTQMDQGNITMNGVLMWKNNIGVAGSPDTVPGQVTNAPTLAFAQGTRAAGKAKNFLVTDLFLRRAFEFSDPDWRALFGSPIFRAGWVAPPDDGFFDQSAKFIGGIGDEDWTAEWTNWLNENDIAQ